ncbi:MAG: hypothetical protein JF586_01430 [Burkholderiales bacterium]|nr:hypothetical protein [Burkholderiales bacterium]
MSGTTHDMKWRLLVGAAPVIGVAFFVWSAAQGPSDVARSPTARAILALVAALGAGVAWWTARQLRATPSVTVSRASARAMTEPGGTRVSLRGRAVALPDAVPLISPDGELCLWFAAADEPAAQGCVRPFLLEDDTGQCIVLPAGAEVRGTGPLSAAAARSRLPGGGDDVSAQRADEAGGERLLRTGDRIHVIGRFVPASSQALMLQAQAAALVARNEGVQAPLRGGDVPPFRDLRTAAQAGAPFVAAPPLAGRGLALPVIAAGNPGEPFEIRLGSDEAEGGVYGMLAIVDVLVLVVSSSLAAWGVLVHG